MGPCVSFSNLAAKPEYFGFQTWTVSLVSVMPGPVLQTAAQTVAVGRWPVFRA